MLILLFIVVIAFYKATVNHFMEMSIPLYYKKIIEQLVIIAIAGYNVNFYMFFCSVYLQACERDLC